MFVTFLSHFDEEVYFVKLFAGFAVQASSDLVFLYCTKRMYKPIMDANPAWQRRIPAFIVYPLVASAVSGLFECDSLLSAAASGSVIGFWVFSAFDITLWAIQRRYPTGTAVIDVIYGSCLTSVMFLVQKGVSGLF